MVQITVQLQERNGVAVHVDGKLVFIKDRP